MSVKFRFEILSLFKCQNSGNCCRYPGYVYITDHSVPTIAESLGLDSQSFIDSYTRKNKGWTTISSPSFRPDCFLDCDNKCSIYEHRPKACRTYPNWDHIWESEESLNSEIESCPGLKKAVDEFKRKQKN